jgi:hypothetical protein
MSVVVEPVGTEGGVLVWAGLGGVVRAAKDGESWRFIRPGLDEELVLPWGAPPRLAVSLGRLPVMLRLQTPVIFGARERRTLWASWPLVVTLAVEPFGEVDRFRPGIRQTLLGTTESGVVLPALVSEVRAERPLVDLPMASLRLHVENISDETVILRRAPIEEGGLGLFTNGGQLIAGDVTVKLVGGDRAESYAAPGQPPLGFQPVSSETPSSVRRRAPLEWLMDATRRSVEFKL